MANTYTQCYFQLVFAVRNRTALINRKWKDDLEKYVSGIIHKYRHKVLAVGSMPDHLHILIGYNVNHLIPDLVEEVKTSSNLWINTRGFTGYKFDWQKGYGAFTYSRSQIDVIIKYIMSQEEHHKEKSFRDEYLEILQKNMVEYNQAYLFEFFDDDD